jgi:hypothetical protein
MLPLKRRIPPAFRKVLLKLYVFEGYLTSCHTFGTEMNDMKRRVEQIQNSKYLLGFTHINISESAGTANKKFTISELETIWKAAF